MKQLKAAIYLTLFFGLTGNFTYSNVSLKNGNFFIGYTDIVYTGGFEPKVERVYNSKSPYHTGMFGWGWGTEYEVRLTVSADSSVVIHEYGGGAENRFVPVNFKRKDLEKAVRDIVQISRKSGALSNKSQAKSYQDRLLKDAVFRNAEWEKLVSQKKLKRRDVKVGTQFVSNRFSYQYVTKMKNGYRRVFDNGKVEDFNEQGRLVQIADKNNNLIKLSYNKAGQLVQMIDNFNRKIHFHYNNDGLVSRIDGENKKRAHYQYNKLRELVSSKDVDGNFYRYEYSKDKRHNMVRILYSDKTTMDIAYYGRDQKENVKSIKDRDGTQTNYFYKYHKPDNSHYTVGYKIQDKSGRTISTASYEYIMKYKNTGETWTYRMISSLDGQKTETTYNKCCGLPILIKRGKDITSFKYDKKGHVIEKSTPNLITKLQYHKKFGKVTRVDKFSKLTKRKDWSQFKYDGKGNLIFAKNSEKQGVKLIYDRNGRIASMVDHKKRVIQFKYNENSKPVEIKDPKLGAINVSYTNSGQIKKVESSAGRRIALQVTSAFQNLLDIIRPAGVTLAF